MDPPGCCGEALSAGVGRPGAPSRVATPYSELALGIGRRFGGLGHSSSAALPAPSAGSMAVAADATDNLWKQGEQIPKHRSRRRYMTPNTTHPQSPTHTRTRMRRTASVTKEDVDLSVAPSPRRSPARGPALRRSLGRRGHRRRGPGRGPAK